MAQGFPDLNDQKWLTNGQIRTAGPDWGKLVNIFGVARFFRKICAPLQNRSQRKSDVSKTPEMKTAVRAAKARVWNPENL